MSESDGSIVLKVEGVGYRVFTVGFSIVVNEKLSLHIYDHIREDRRDLYGFADLEVLRLFEALIGISGVGTKLAQKIFAAHSSDELSARITQGDVEFLTGISGVGKKTAQKIVLELKGVLALEEVYQKEDTETLDALVSLGYSRVDGMEVIQELQSDTVEEKIMEALKLLGKNL